MNKKGRAIPDPAYLLSSHFSWAAMLACHSSIQHSLGCRLAIYWVSVKNPDFTSSGAAVLWSAWRTRGLPMAGILCQGSTAEDFYKRAT